MEKNNAGRPQEDEYKKWIEGKEDVILAACRNGASVPDLCKIIGCRKTTAGQVISVKSVKKFIPPDTGAAMAWLKNRQPAKWRDKQEVDLTVNPFMELMKSATASETDDE